MAGEVFFNAVRSITEGKLSATEAIDAAEKLKAEGRSDLVIQLYKIWVKFNPGDGLLAVAYFNQAVAHSELGDNLGAKEALEAALACNPDFYPAYINLGSTLERLGAPDQAVAQWMNLVNRLPQITGLTISYKTTALKQIGRVLEAQHHSANAEKVLRQGLTIDPNQSDVAQHVIALRLGQCKWPVVEPWEGVSRKALMRGISPLSMGAYTDDPMLQLANAWAYNKDLGDPPLVLSHPRRPGKGRRRIGYVSSDLRQHAIGFLMPEVFELHDRQAFEIFVYYCGIPTNDDMNARIKGAVEHWVDINGMDDLTAARRIAADEIDILVDVNGYTRDMRTKMFSYRPAPVIVNWLGYPGTMGSPYHHYLIADDWIVPQGHEIYFSEKVVRLPCYQPNDRKRLIAERPTRASARLPDDAMVYCCFNGLQKLTRFTFERWCTILSRVPDSVLWLLSENERLTEFARQRGIDPSRIIYADKLANPYHLARYPLADLFLDTSPYGAHTTASDALFMGVPILTLSGRSFPARVCGSLARSAGLADLVCETPEEYVERAVALGSDRAAIADYKRRLEQNRATCTLFDMNKLVHHLEDLYRGMWDDFRNGRLPRPDLANLDVYLDIGIEEDHEAVEVLTIKDYQGWYREKLARRHAIRPIGPDRRLWTEADIAGAEKRLEKATAAE